MAKRADTCPVTVWHVTWLEITVRIEKKETESEDELLRDRRSSRI